MENDFYLEKFKKRFKMLRNEKKLTMKELGQKLSVAESTISGYENGNRKPDMATVGRIADFFSVSIDYLYGRTDERNGTASNSTNDNLFFFDIEGLTQEEIDDIKRHIDYVKWKSKHGE